MWWYQHHGRLATDGRNFAASFGVAITARNGSCVDIHEGDRMQAVGPDGGPVAHKDAFEVGAAAAGHTGIGAGSSSVKVARAMPMN